MTIIYKTRKNQTVYTHTIICGASTGIKKAIKECYQIRQEEPKAYDFKIYYYNHLLHTNPTVNQLVTKKEHEALLKEILANV